MLHQLNLIMNFTIKARPFIDRSRSIGLLVTKHLQKQNNEDFFI